MPNGVTQLSHKIIPRKDTPLAELGEFKAEWLLREILDEWRNGGIAKVYLDVAQRTIEVVAHKQGNPIWTRTVYKIKENTDA